MDRKSFIVYFEWFENIEDLSEKDFKKLILAIKNYAQNGDDPKLPGVMQMAFKFIKGDLDRDLEKYKETVERNRENGKKGGRPKQNPTKPKKPTGLLQNPLKPKKADNDNDNDNEDDNVNENENVDVNVDDGLNFKAYSFLKKNIPIQMEQYEMKDVRRLNPKDRTDLIEYFNAAVLKEDLKTDVKILFGRFQTLSMTWIKNLKEKNKNKPMVATGKHKRL